MPSLKSLYALAACCCLLAPLTAEEAKTIEIRAIGMPPDGIDGQTSASGIYYDIANLLAAEAGYLSSPDCS